ncbi:CDC48 family AAA ATPase [Candidatus Woesearchaeota archaeon]|nr:CDC48 family AAA ATPase [Candidatus Woesearchaeota archaeon]
MDKVIELKVAEAQQDDVYKGIVRVDSSIMQNIDVRPGDIIEVEGERATVAIIDRALPADIGLTIIRMDPITRKNARTSIDEIVKIKKAVVKEANSVIIAPATKGVYVKGAPNTFKMGLLGRTAVKGDIVSLGGMRRRKNTLVDSPFSDLFPGLGESFVGFGFGDLRFMIVETNPKQAVIVSDNTQIILNPQAVELKEDLISEIAYEDIGGLEDELGKIREMVELPLKHPELFQRLGIEPPKGVLLHGPPGTGKTLLAKAVANETNAHFISINGPEIMSKFYGQSEENLRNKFEDAEKNSPSIIFIDEIDAIATKREETQGDVEKRVVAQLLALMDGLKSRGKVIVIAASNIPNTLDPALRRPGRFDREIEIGIPTKAAREEILKIHIRNMPLDEGFEISHLANVTHGFVGADLESLAKEAAMVVLRRVLPELELDKEEPVPVDVLEKLKVTMDDFKQALKYVRPSALREVLVDIPNINWEEIGGLDEVKQELKEAVEWPIKFPEAFVKLGITPPKGILLYGPPGTGKTLLAKAVASESEFNFILVKGSELLSKWVGESEKGVKKIFAKARQASPSIIFFDEIDALAPSRNVSSNNDVSEKVVNQLLTEIDGLEEMHDVVIIGATNRPDILDPALLRPGRFDRIVLVGAPDEKNREIIFKVHTKKMPLAKDIDISKLAKKTDSYVGADIAGICKEAAIFALRENMDAKEVQMKHFEEAIKKVRPSATKEIIRDYMVLQEKFRTAKANEMKEEKPRYMG